MYYGWIDAVLTFFFNATVLITFRWRKLWVKWTFSWNWIFISPTLSNSEFQKPISHCCPPPQKKKKLDETLIRNPGKGNVIKQKFRQCWYTKHVCYLHTLTRKLNEGHRTVPGCLDNVPQRVERTWVKYTQGNGNKPNKTQVVKISAGAGN